ncbi:MAG: hypothetical protein WAO58_05830 [Fimbriimonadaceae bacterium]
MPSRIKSDPAGLSAQMTMAIAAIGALGPGVWPTNAPQIPQITTDRDNINTSITDTEAKENSWKTAAQLKGERRDIGFDTYTRVIQAATLLFGPQGAELNAFGVPPEGMDLPPLHKLTDVKFTDGIFPGSLKSDWEAIEGATYEVQWSTVITFATLVGSAISASASDYTISGLVPGTQYFMRVRPARGSELAEWSDPETRFAPL